MSRAKLVDYYIEKSKHPDFEIDHIRKELKNRNLPEKEIRVIVRLVDDALQHEMYTKTNNNKAREITVAGIFLMALGAGITIATYTNLIPSGTSYLIVYGPFFVGLSLFLGGLASKKEP